MLVYVFAKTCPLVHVKVNISIFYTITLLSGLQIKLLKKNWLKKRNKKTYMIGILISMET